MVALPLELIVSLIGIIMLTPIFAPEENSDLADLMLSKSFSYFKIIGFRVLYSFVMLVVFIGSFTVFLSYQHSDVTMMHFLGTIASAIFLGGLGLCIAAICNHVIVGYMGAMLFYVMNFFSGDQLKGLYLFGMAEGSSYEKYWQALIGIFMIGLAFLRKRNRITR